MAIGTPNPLGSAFTGSSVTTLGITTTASAPAGSMIAVSVSLTSGGTAPTVTDTAGNTYTSTGENLFGLAGRWTLFICPNAAALGSGGTITASWSGAASPVLTAFSVTGLDTTSPLDIKTAVTTGSAATSVSPAVNSGTLGQANELILGVTGVDGNPGTWSITSGGGYAVLQAAGGSGDNETHTEWKIVSATTAVTANPSWVNNRTYGSLIYTFKEASAPAPSGRSSNALLMGVGMF